MHGAPATLLTSPQALYALHAILGEHVLVDAAVANFKTWEELARTDPAERAFRLGAWAAQLRLPAQCPQLPDMGAGVDIIPRYQRAYPQRLTDLPDPPVLLYHRQTLPEGPYVAVGGSHFPSDAGFEISRSAARAAVHAGLAVVAALDSGAGQVAIETAVELGGRVLAVSAGDLAAPSHHSELVGKILEGRGAVMSEWGPGEAWSESRIFAAGRLVAAMGSAVVLTELGTHPAGGAHLARAAVATGRFLVVPEPPSEDMVGAAHTGVAVLGRARSFSARVFGANPRMLNRIGRGEPAADAVVRSEAEMAGALRAASGR